jgi:hypothetical protein
MSLLKRFLILCLPIALFAMLFVIDLAPSGRRMALYTPGEISAFVERPLPDDRIGDLEDENGEAYYPISGDPVYLGLHTPVTTFDELELEVQFRPNELEQIEIGPQVDIFSGAANLQGLYQGHIEDLDWAVMEQGDIRVFQRNLTFDSVDAFLADLPPSSQIATYQYDLEVPYVLDDYEPLRGTRRIYSSLRGYHKVVTYIKNEEVVLDLTLMDMNRTTGPDDFTVRIWNAADELAWESTIGDDGNESENQISTTIQFEEVIDARAWPEGVYTIEFVATSDLFFREMETSLRYFTFVNQLYLADDVGYLEEGRASAFSTNARHFALETFHADAPSSIEIGEEVFAIPETHEKVYANLEADGVVRAEVPVGGIKIVGDGKFAFTEDAFFDPDPHALGPLSDLEGLGINYVVTTYQSPRREGDWYVGTVKAPINGLEDEEGNLRLVLSMPYSELVEKGMDFGTMHVTFLREPLTWGTLFSRLFEYLPGR